MKIFLYSHTDQRWHPAICFLSLLSSLWSCFPSLSIRTFPLVKRWKWRGKIRGVIWQPDCQAWPFHQHPREVSKTQPHEHCSRGGRGTLLSFLGQDGWKMALPSMPSSLLLVLSLFGRKHRLLLCNPCKCLLPYLSALELIKESLCLSLPLTHPNSSWINLVLQYAVCAGSVNFWGYKSGPCACHSRAF